MFNNEQFAAIHFCARECKNQRSGELSVGWMLDAYEYATTIQPPLTVKDILIIGSLVEPTKIVTFRHVPITFSNGSKVPWENIDRQIDSLIEAQSRLTPTEFYIEFEQIHPFEDGNGRTGAILFNLLNNTLNQPKMPEHRWR